MCFIRSRAPGARGPENAWGTRRGRRRGGTVRGAFPRFVWRPLRRALTWDAWIILGLVAGLMVTDVFTNSFEIYLFDHDGEKLSFLAYGVAQVWDGAGVSVDAAVGRHTAFWYM